MDQQQATLDVRTHYSIKTEQFEGPLDLLLSLIEKRKLFINDFSLAGVADDYIARIRTFENFPVADVANFLIIASALVLIKSKSILPQLTLSQEEEGDIDDLKLRLRLYELFRAQSTSIRSHFGTHPLYSRRYVPRDTVLFAPDTRVTPDLLRQSIDHVINALPKHVVLPKATVKKVVSLEEMVTKLAERIKSALKLNFSEFSTYKKGSVVTKEERVHVIIGFLAMLEMVKQGMLHVSQQSDFDDIQMETHDLQTPAYT